MKVWFIPTTAERVQGWTSKTLFRDGTKYVFDEVRNPYSLESDFADFLLENYPDHFKTAGPSGGSGPSPLDIEAEIERRVEERVKKIRTGLAAEQPQQGKPGTVADSLAGLTRNVSQPQPTADTRPPLERIAAESNIKALRVEAKKRQIKVPPGSSKLDIVKLIDEKVGGKKAEA